MEPKTIKIYQNRYWRKIGLLRPGLIESEGAASEVVGHMILLAITVISVSMILLYSVPNIQKLEEIITVGNAEYTYEVLSLRAGNIGMGDSISQTVDMSLGGGVLSVVPNGTNNGGAINKESYIVVQDDNNSFKIVVPMGKVTYSLGDRVIAYEGGGLWSKYPSGSIMISEPDLSYNRMTLTLPVTNISGNSSVGGKGIVTMYINKDPTDHTTILYPTGKSNRTNPVDYIKSGIIYVNITSDYYDAWAGYFQKKVKGRIIEKDEKNRTARARFGVASGNLGGRIPLTNPIIMRGIPMHENPLKNFSLRIYPYVKGNGNLAPFNWDFRAQNGNKTLIFDIKLNPPNPAELTIGYHDITIESSGETWGKVFYNMLVDDTGRRYIDIDLLDKNVNLPYANLTVGSTSAMNDPKYCRSPANAGKIVGINDPASSWNNLFINATTNNVQSLYNITEHYVEKMAQESGTIFYQCAPNSGGSHDPDVPPSTMILDYGTSGDITYIHISDNRLEIDIR